MTDNQYNLMTDEEMKLFEIWNESGNYPKSNFADEIISSYFERAEQAIKERELDKDDTTKKAINRLLNAKKKALFVLEKYDVKRIEFENNKSVEELCEVSDTEPDPTRETGDIVSIEKQGYKRSEHLIRPAEVIIVKN